MNKIYQKIFLEEKIPVECRFGGFTLIELLVVVLIIGILAAIALPQYEKAVWTSRSSTMLANVRALANAQEIYFMANNKYSFDFDGLDLSFDSLPQKPSTSFFSLWIASTNAVRANELYELVIHLFNPPAGFLYTIALLKNGPYKGGGFVFVHVEDNNTSEKGLYCVERINQKAMNNFCRQLFGGVNLKSQYNLVFYKLP